MTQPAEIVPLLESGEVRGVEYLRILDQSILRRLPEHAYGPEAIISSLPNHSRVQIIASFVDRSDGFDVKQCPHPPERAIDSPDADPRAGLQRLSECLEVVASRSGS